MFRPQGRKLAYWLGIMEYRTFTYGRDSQDIQIHSWLQQRHHKSMTIKQTTARKNPQSGQSIFCVSLLHSQSFMRQEIGGTFFFLNPKKINTAWLWSVPHRPICRIRVWFCNRLTFLDGKVAWDRDTKENEQSLTGAQLKKQTSLFEGSAAFVKSHKSLVSPCKTKSPYLDRFHRRTAKRLFFRFWFWSETLRWWLSKMGRRNWWAKKVNSYSMEA